MIWSRRTAPSCGTRDAGGGGLPPLLVRGPAAPRADRIRFTRNRTAPAMEPPPPPPPLPPAPCDSSSPITTSAALDSRASLVRRTAMLRESGGAESITTRENAPQRRRTSAHQAARAGSVGRTIHIPSCTPRCAQSRGARVRVASMYATHPPCSTTASAMRRRRVVFPLPRVPTISVSRPRGSPPPCSAPSSSAIPVTSPGTSWAGGGSSARSSAAEIDMALVEGERRRTSTVGGGIKVSRRYSEGKKGAPVKTTDHRPPTTDHRPPTTDHRPPTRSRRPPLCRDAECRPSADGRQLSADGGNGKGPASGRRALLHSSVSRGPVLGPPDRGLIDDRRCRSSRRPPILAR